MQTCLLASLRRPCENCPVKDDFSAGALILGPRTKNKERRRRGASGSGNSCANVGNSRNVSRQTRADMWAHIRDGAVARKGMDANFRRKVPELFFVIQRKK